jgi:hypothetical protein
VNLPWSTCPMVPTKSGLCAGEGHHGPYTQPSAVAMLCLRPYWCIILDCYNMNARKERIKVLSIGWSRATPEAPPSWLVVHLNFQKRVSHMRQKGGDVDRKFVSLFFNRLRSKFHAFCIYSCLFWSTPHNLRWGATYIFCEWCGVVNLI